MIHSSKARKTLAGLDNLHRPSVIRLREYTQIDWGKNRKPSHSRSKHKCTFTDIDFTILSNRIIGSILLTELTYIAKMIISICKPLHVNVTNIGREMAKKSLNPHNVINSNRHGELDESTIAKPIKPKLLM